MAEEKFQSGTYPPPPGRQWSATDSGIIGFKPPVTHQDFPGKEHKLPTEAHYDLLPDYKGGYEKYKSAGKLKGKKAIITGGDSGIGRASAILFAQEGADSLLAYLPDEQKDAEETKQMVESHGQKCYLFPTDLRDRANCQKVVDEALSTMGGIDILFNNAAFQMIKQDISELSEYVVAFCLAGGVVGDANRKTGSSG